ncbi:conserved hypothetical protein [Theileria orientalis strain Shintoku]|uniref:Uncharacterized protein n=1 Tax=Theileria orientalis strain Shintoku TaxID=869250 RepID=J4CCT0_THEOR|nr:conserved hypothetical protein [Theileria orientalis strain Shintoku]BAM39927.1 conserved hypothetical protein [Theileria orientalis strain Shintoku]|eukprot:XP_009690228.1 conserved hypothetical protein [Theileria orientalis strain Shintoku]
MARLIMYKALTLMSVLVYNRNIESVNNDVLNLDSDSSELMLMRFNEGTGAYIVSSYLTNIRSRITKIMDGPSTMWVSDLDDETLSLLKVYKLYGKNRLAYVYSLGHLIRQTRYLVRQTRYFEKINNNWYEIPEFYFDYKLERLRKERIFDLKSDIDYDTFYVQDLSLYGLETLVFIPYDIYDIISVCDDFDVIWERNNDSDKCTCIIVHGDLRNSQLIHLHLKINNTHKQMFMRKYEDDWKQTDKEQFYQYLNQLDDQMIVNQMYNNDL